MRYAERHREETHTRIVDRGKSMIRSLGLAGTSVERVMRSAGLTVGGFYAHFESKNVFSAEVVRAGLLESRDRILKGLEPLDGVAFVAALVGRYLSTAHRDAVETGCVVPATLSEISRAGEPTQRAFTEQVDDFVREIAPRFPGDTASAKRHRVLSTLALCFGGIALARAVNDPKLSTEILRACREAALRT